MTHADRAEFLRGIAAGLRERAEDIGQIWPRESGALHVIARRSAAGIAGAFDYYAGLAAELSLRGAGAADDGGVRPARAGAGRRRRRHHPVERPDRADHLQARPGPAGRVHGGPQVLTRGPRRRLRGGRDRRGHRPSGRGAERRHRRSRGVRAAGARCPRGQDHLHRLDRRRPADRVDLRRADRPLHARTGWEVGRRSSSTTWTCNEAAATLASAECMLVGTGVLLADPDRRHPPAPRRAGRRAGRRLLPGPRG